MKTIQFRDFIILQRGFDLPKHIRDEGEYPVIAATGIHGSHSEFKVNPPGVVTGRSGSLGEVVFVERPYWPLNTTLWVKDFKENQPRYVYYFLKTLDLKRFNSGAGVPTLNRNHLDTLVVKIHDRQNQQKIAAILSVYDDLIGNNLRRIKILEEMAQTFYREWFVKFRFPGHQKVKMMDSPLGKIPEGWEVKLLKEICESINYGYTASARQEAVGPRFLRITDIVPYLIDWYSVPYCEISEKELPKYLLKEGDIVIARTGATTGYAKQINKMHPESVFASYLVRIRIKSCYGRLHIGLLVESDEYKRFIKTNLGGAAQPQANAQVLTSFPLVIPAQNLLNSFESFLRNVFDQRDILHHKNMNLRQTRDLLLPKLISGELDVSELDIRQAPPP